MMKSWGMGGGGGDWEGGGQWGELRGDKKEDSEGPEHYLRLILYPFSFKSVG